MEYRDWRIQDKILWAVSVQWLRGGYLGAFVVKFVKCLALPYCSSGHLISLFETFWDFNCTSNCAHHKLKIRSYRPSTDVINYYIE